MRLKDALKPSHDLQQRGSVAVKCTWPRTHFVDAHDGERHEFELLCVELPEAEGKLPTLYLQSGLQHSERC